MEAFWGIMTLGLAWSFILMISLYLGGIAFSIWMLIDCIEREESNFKDKTLWTVILIAGIFFGYSLIISTVYYFVVKKELDK